MWGSRAPPSSRASPPTPAPTACTCSRRSTRGRSQPRPCCIQRAHVVPRAPPSSRSTTPRPWRSSSTTFPPRRTCCTCTVCASQWSTTHPSLSSGAASRTLNASSCPSRLPGPCTAPARAPVTLARSFLTTPTGAARTTPARTASRRTSRTPCRRTWSASGAEAGPSSASRRTTRARGSSTATWSSTSPRARSWPSTSGPRSSRRYPRTCPPRARARGGRTRPGRHTATMRGGHRSQTC
mmetsp:Transcript_43362/g.123639  ORF Transcript_43362/g.123639 Transcript_43362/m.123639 type:complete len:239 (+) Transcript_43362:529-1245(+)